MVDRAAAGVFLLMLGTAAAFTTAPFDLTSYNDWPEFEAYLIETARLNPGLVKLLQIGESHEGRPLLGLLIGKTQRWKKAMVWLDGGNHAREWPAFHTAVYFIEQLINLYGISEKITNYVDTLDFLVFPVLNPDGFVYSRTDRDPSIRQWRKNRAPENCTGITGSRKDVCCAGVDLNRNYDFAFSHRNYPFNNACSDEYQGAAPFSEPESRAVRDFITSRALRGRIHAVVSLHTHGQLIILPFNARRKQYPEDFDDLQELALRVAARIRSFRDTTYRVGTAADMLGPATGGATDWIKANTKIKYVYVFELPPDMKTFFAFQIKPHWLIPIGRETWAGVQVIIEQVIAEFVENGERRLQ